MFSHFFKNARNFRITGGSFVQVQGDQINNITTIVQAKEKERTELDEYFEVKRGAIYRLRKKWSYKYPRRWDDGRRWGWEQRLPRADRTIHAAELVDRPGKVFTVVEYTGPEAKKAFEDDFALLIRNLTFNAVQMYGYNLSSLPSILLYNELVPAAHLNAGTIGRVYLYSLCMQLGCKDEELWLDPGRGVFCYGLQGPIPKQLSIWSFGNEELPLNAELIQEDVLLRFLASINSRQVDKVIIMGVASSGAFGFDVPERVLSRLTVVSTLTNAPIAIANSFWESEDKSLSDRNLLGNGMTRFTFNGGHYLALNWSLRIRQAWMAQAWSIFSARRISLEEDLGAYQLLYHDASLVGYTSNFDTCRRIQQPIYLFIRSTLPDFDEGETSSLHYWSFDEDGHSTLSDNLCNNFGLPTTLRFEQSFQSHSWSNDDYSCSRQYQLLRGFDPATTDFARSLGYDHRLFYPLNDSDRFAQVNQQEPPLEDGASALAAHVPTTEDLITAHPTRPLHGFGATTTDLARHARVVSQPVNDPDRFEHVQEDSECEPPISTTSKTSAGSAQSTGLLSALLSPLSSTLSNDSEILTIGF